MRNNMHIPSPVFKKHLCYPVAIGHYYDFPEHYENREKGLLTEYNLHLVLRGKGYVIHQNQKIHLSEGSGFLYPKGAKQQYGTDPDDPWEIYFMHFDAVAEITAYWNIDHPEGWFFRFKGIQQVQRIFTEMLELITTFKTNHEPHLAALIYELILFIMLNSEAIQKANSLDQKERIHLIADSIHDSPSYPWTSEYLAEISGYSQYHFIRLFKKVMGVNPNEYIKECRIVTAKNMLISSELPIFEIALQTGYSQTSYFIRIFREKTGLTPQMYRIIHGYMSNGS